MKKPLYKKIGHGVKKYHSHFTKYLYERDTIFATLWVFIFIVVLGSIPINFYFLNPLKLALKDFDFNDMTYAKLGRAKNVSLDSNIVIINVGHEDREGLAMLVEKTASYGPKVMGLDVEFPGPGPDPEKDSILWNTIKRHDNLVLVSRLNWYNKLSLEDKGYYGDVANKQGHANLIGESPEERRTIRYYSVYEKEKKIRYLSFGSALLREFDQEAFERSMERKKKHEMLNYTRHTNQYQVIEPEQLLLDQVEDSVIRGKIALLGYINHDPRDIEDKVYTPLNDKFVGKSTPDMNGIVVHANYISMVLSNDYIKKLPSWVNWLVAVLICWLHMSFFVRYYLENHIWFHLVAKIAQLLSAIFFAYVGIILYSRFNIKLDMGLSLVVIVLAVDVIYFYEAFAVWIHKKFHYHTVFHQKHH